MNEPVFNSAVPPDPDRTSEILVRIAEQDGSGAISLEMLAGALRSRAYGLMLFVFALPTCFPMPPGIPTLCGLVMILIGVHLVVDRKALWLPGFLARRSIDRSSLRKGVARVLPAIRLIERVSRPRMAFTGRRPGRAAIGLVVVVLGLILLLPIPLVGNIPPGIAAAVIGIGMTERDGVVVLAGFLAAAVAIGLNSTFVWAVATGAATLL